MLDHLEGCRREEYSFYSTMPTFFLTVRAARELLPALCAAGQCLLARTLYAYDQSQPLAWDAAGRWTFRIRAEREASGDAYRISGELARGAERRALTDVTCALPGGMILFHSLAADVDDRGLYSWLQFFRKEPSLQVPVGQKLRLLEELLRLSDTLPPELTEALGVAPVERLMLPAFHVKKPRLNHGQTWLEGELTFRYGAITASTVESRPWMLDAAAGAVVRRDAGAESRAWDRLRELKLSPAGSIFRIPVARFARVAQTLLAEGWHVEAEGKLYRRPGAFQLEIKSSDIDWFELHGGVTYDDQVVSLPRLLAALKSGDGMIALDDGTFGLLPEKWLQKYGLLARTAQAKDEHLRFSSAQIGLLDALLAEQPDVSWDENARHARERFERFAGVEPVDPPPEFQGVLRGYQREGLGWLRFLQDFRWGGCLADDMGLGKTVQVLALLASRAGQDRKKEPRTSLVVMPSSLLFNWAAEAARFAPGLKVLRHHGLDRIKTADHLLAHDVVLTTYATLRRDVLLFKDIDFDYCILDESQAVKNVATEQAKAVRLLRGRHRLAMSGTPIENHVGELWGLLDFLNPGMLGHASLLQRAGGSSRVLEPETRPLLARALRPFILRRTKDQVAADLPEKTEQTLFCDLEPEDRKLYDELRDYYRQSLLGKIERDGLAKSKIQVLEALLRLRQAACHPGLLDKKQADKTSSKLEALLPRLREVVEEGHKALVFSQFTSLLSIVKGHLNAEKIAYEYLDGRTRDRASRVERFQSDPNCKLFLISLKAGGVGLNLTAAEYVFLLDPWWNPAVEAQAIDRTHRIGQTRPVFAYRIIARNTVEEKVLELQKSKRELADAILNADNSLIRNLAREDLELLLS